MLIEFTNTKTHSRNTKSHLNLKKVNRNCKKSLDVRSFFFYLHTRGKCMVQRTLLFPVMLAENKWQSSRKIAQNVNDLVLMQNSILYK